MNFPDGYFVWVECWDRGECFRPGMGADSEVKGSMGQFLQEQGPLSLNILRGELCPGINGLAPFSFQSRSFTKEYKALSEHSCSNCRRAIRM